MKLNVEAGCFLPMKVTAKRWIKKKVPGCIINIASMASYVPLSGVWAYDAAKAAVKNLTEGAAKEFAPYGIRINAIAPGFFPAFPPQSTGKAQWDVIDLTDTLFTQ